MGYDFHLTPHGPRLIEVNTNAGGALLNGLHTASLCDPEKLACLCADLLPVETLEQKIVETFAAEFAAVRGPAARLARVAIVDDRPREQFLYPEFELFQTPVRARRDRGAHRRHRARSRRRRAAASRSTTGPSSSSICATPISRSPRSARARCARPTSRAPSSSRRRRASTSCWPTSAGSRSSPREPTLRALGVAADDARLLATVIPETRGLAELGARGCLAQPGRVGLQAGGVLRKPGGLSRRQDLAQKIRRPSLHEASYVAQRRVEPGLVTVETSDGPRAMKFDVRAYAYRERVLLLGARVYEGQVTNLRSPGGGFSAICVTRR